MTINVVGLGGSLRLESQSERALRIALEGAAVAGAKTTMLAGTDLVLPFYDPADSERSARARRLLEELRAADGVVMVSPGYHGSISGLVKNALDYIEDLRDDPRPYLHGRAVGCVAIAYGWQAAVNTLSSLRSIVHALRGWPTPFGASINSAQVLFGPNGECSDGKAEESLRTIGSQVVEFATSRV